MNKKGRKGNHDLKWSSPFNYQPKSRALATLFSRPALKKKKTEKGKARKIKSQKHTKAERRNHQKNTFPREALLIHDHACNF